MTPDANARHGHCRRRAADLSLLKPGEHLYALYRGRRELRRVASAFVRSGRAAGDRVVYVACRTGPDTARELLEAGGVDAGAPARSGQLVLRAFRDVYPAVPDDAAALAGGYRAAVRLARTEGFAGQRVATEMDGFPAAIGSLDQLLRWERMASHLHAQVGMTTTCQYDRRLLEGSDAAGRRRAHGARRLRRPAPARHLPGDKGAVGPPHRRRGGPVQPRRLHPGGTGPPGGAPNAYLGLAEQAIYQAAADLPPGGRIAVMNLRPQVRRVVDLADLGDALVEIEQ